MPEILRPENLCNHDSGISMTNREVLCADCGTEMVFVPKKEWAIRTVPGAREQELQRLLNTRTAALLRISQYLREVGVG